MKSINLFIALFALSFAVLGSGSYAQAQEAVSQDITLEPGWNIVSTPKVLESQDPHTFSADETSENFDIYLLDASQPSGWALMQDTFTPLYGYFINNKTGTEQTLTFNYATNLSPNEKLFERTFSTTGWYSIGVADDEYAKEQDGNVIDTNNPSKILSLMEGKYDRVIDFTDSVYSSNPESVTLSDPWKGVAPVYIDDLNDLRETKGYAIYVKESDSKYIGFQNDAELEVVLTGEAVLQNFDTASALDDEIEEGAQDTVVMSGTAEFTNGDAEISRMDVAFVADGANDEMDPWDTFDTVSLWVDGDMVAEENAGQVDYYYDQNLGVLRFDNLGIIALSDEAVEIIVAVSVKNPVEGAYDGEGWTVAINNMRFFDADGVATTLDSNDDSRFRATEYFSVEEGGNNDELIVKTSPNDPDAATLKVEDDSKSDWYTVFIFDLDTGDSTNDIVLKSVPVEVTVSSSTYDNIVDDAELVINGVTIGYYEYTDGATATLVFDANGYVVITAGDRVAAELMLRFNALDLANEGITVTGSITSSNVDAIDAEGFDDLSPFQLSGAATGDAHTLRTQGIEVSPDSSSAVVTAGDNVADDYATFEMELEVTAFEQDAYISTDPSISVDYTLQDGSGAASVAGSRSVVLTSTADEQGAYFEIREGETQTLTLTVTYSPGLPGTSSRLVLNSISFGETATPPTQTQTLLPETDYRTNIVTIVN